jgi:bleomycin hydrolase
MGHALHAKDVQKYSARLSKNPIHHIAKTALNKVGIDRLIVDGDEPISRVFKYRVKPLNIEIANQYSSGRCWIFSFTNLMRRKMMHKYNLPPTFKLSQKYLMFYDKLEKCNAYMECIYFMLTKKKLKHNSLEVAFMQKEAYKDGGTWGFFKELVLKYGVVPYEAYPDNEQAKSSAGMNDVLNQYLRSSISKIAANTNRDDFTTLKQQTLEECYAIIESFLGKPPTDFVWEYVTKKEKFVTSAKLTPIDFYTKYVKPTVNVDDFVVLINDPRNEYYKLYSVELLHNVLPISEAKIALDRIPTNKLFNVPMEVMMTAVYNSIRSNTPVPFASDVSHLMNIDDSVMSAQDTYKDLLGVQLVYPRKFLVSNNMTSPSHEMIFIACNGPSGEWQVENSWKQQNMDYKYLTMNNDWFTHYVCEVVVHKSYISTKLYKTYSTLVNNENYTWYALWDIFGRVADLGKSK